MQEDNIVVIGLFSGFQTFGIDHGMNLILIFPR